MNLLLWYHSECVGRTPLRFIDFLEGRDFRIETKVVARKEREKENPSKAHLPLEE